MERNLNTMPVLVDEVGRARGGLDDYRLSSPDELQLLLKRLVDGNVILSLNGSDGTVYSTTLWAIDTSRGTLSFSADADNSQVRALVEAEDAVVVAYLDSIKLQFDAPGLVLVRGNGNCALNCAFPREIFRFQRRSGFRVRPLLRSVPVARVRHPMIPDMPLALRVLDISIGGCALFLPDDVPPLQPGILINGVQVDLDADTRITTSLRLQHVTSLNPDSHGVRLGCEMENPSSEVLRVLQRFIDQTQKRQRMLAR